MILNIIVFSLNWYLSLPPITYDFINSFGALDRLWQFFYSLI
jgi:hypothetical protein